MRACFAFTLPLAIVSCGRSELHDLLPVTDAAPDTRFDAPVDLGIDTAPATDTSPSSDSFVCTDFAFAPQVTYATGNSPTSVAIADFNHDGFLDLAVTSGYSQTLAIYTNAGNGTFGAPVTYATGQYPNGIAVADFNRDGNPDVALCNENDNTLAVYRNQGDGTFALPNEVYAGAYPWSVVAGDFYSKGIFDLVVATEIDGIQRFANQGYGTFGMSGTYDAPNAPKSISVGHLSSQKFIDFAVANSGTNTVGTFANRGDGTFAAGVTYATGPLGEHPYGLAIGDFNQDGWDDLAVANNISSTLAILFNTGVGSFGPPVTYAVHAYANAIAVGDFNGDTLPDIAVTASSYPADVVSVFLNQGGGTMQVQNELAVGTGADSIAVGDLNGDGLADIAVANYGDNTVSVLLSQCP